MQVHSCRSVAENPSVECASEAQIEKVADEVVLDVFIKNFYFDENEFDEDPVKSYVEYYYYPINSVLGKAVLYKLRHHITELADSWLSSFNDKTYVEYLSFTFGYDYTRAMGQNFFGQKPWYFAIWFV